MKKEYIVKLVFTGIVIFMLWWAFLIWQRFATPQLAGQPMNKAAVLMFWYDTQGKRGIPEDAKLQNFSMDISKDGIVESVKVTVLGEKDGETKKFTYTEDKDTKKRIFKEEKTSDSMEGLIRAQTFFSRFQKIYLPKYVKSEVSLRSNGKSEILSEVKQSYVIKGDLVEELQGDAPVNHVPLVFKGNEETVFYLPTGK